MPRPIDRAQRYLPGLDGLRAVAVLSVVLFHLGWGGAQGGLLGVGVFFTLSGYLITDLLLGEWRREGHLRLADFWQRRARRLLPALFVMLAVVAIWTAVGAPNELGSVRGDIAAAAVYGSNWWLIFQHVSYFGRFGPPSPLGHLWSLAVEEQFYLLWPWLLLGGLWWVRRVPAGPHRRTALRRRLLILAGATTFLAMLSAIEMAVLYQPSIDPTRVYDATDTRAFGLLFGAALAMVWPSRALSDVVSQSARWVIDAMGVVGLLGIALLVWRTNEYSGFLYQGGMVLLSLATMLVIASASHPASRFARALGWGPLRWLGMISYGIYLWHYPIIVFTTPAITHGVDLPRATLQVAATLAVASASWYLVEQPIRRGALGRLWERARAQWTGGIPQLHPKAWLATSFALVGLAVTSLGIAGLLPSASAGVLTAYQGDGAAEQALLTRSISVNLHVAGTPTQSSQQAATSDPGKAGHGKTGRGTTGHGRTGHGKGRPGTKPTVTTTTTTPPAPMTSCTSVAYLGDSTSESLVSNDYLNPPQQLPAQLERVGVQNVNLQISGARSLVETYEGQPNGTTVAQELVGQGFHGCWIIALGTNDAANVGAGSRVNGPTRITNLMAVIGNQPVMWVNVVSEVSSGPYSATNMSAWDSDLLQACPHYPNMRIFDWASMVQSQWYIPDGIHYNTPGSAVRAAAIANALANAFPAGAAKAHSAAPPSCVVTAATP